MGRITLEDTISNLELNIRWIEDNPAHQFAGYGNVVMAMRDALELLKEQKHQIWELQELNEYLNDKQKKKFLVDSDGKITPLPVVVRCKDCKHRGDSKKCVLSAISEEKDFPLFMLDNRGEWFCADGEIR